MLNIAGPEYDFASVVFVVLGECEHRRRALEDDTTFAKDLRAIADDKLQKIKAAYDEFGGSPAYWKSLEKEVLQTAMPQYIDHAWDMNALEQNGYGVWRGGDPAARFLFALLGLIVGSVIIALPFIPIFETMFAFALTAIGFLYPEVKRYTHERRHARFLNRLIGEAAQYQQNAKLHYMTTTDIRESFTLVPPPAIDTTSTTESSERLQERE